MTADTAKDARGGEDFAVTNRAVFTIALPMTLAYLSTPLVGLADTFTIGQLGDAALIGAVAFGSIIFDIAFTGLSFLRTGTTGLVAQAMGAGNRREEAAIVFRALIMAALLGVAVVALQVPILEGALWFLGGTDAVREAVGIYFSIRVLGTPLALGNYAVLGYLLGRGRAGSGLALQLILNATNIGLNLLFVLGFGWGVAGVALASIIAEGVALLVGTILVWHRLKDAPLPSRDQVLDRAALWRMVAINRDILIRSFALLFAFALFTRLSAAQGEIILAANAILQKYLMLVSYFLDGMAVAAEQLVGRAVGAFKRKLFWRAVKLCTFWTALFSAAATLVLVIIGGPLLDIMTTAESVRAAGAPYLIFAALMPVAGALAFLMDGVFIGATWSRDMRNMMLVSLLIFWLLTEALMPPFGNAGLWTALLIFLGLRGVTLLAVLPFRARQTFNA